MTILPNQNKHLNWRVGFSHRLAATLAAAFIPMAMAGSARAQVAPQGDAGGYRVAVGGTATGMYVQYGERKMLGATGFFDFDTSRRLGIEGEAKFMRFNQTKDLFFDTYSIGGRYRIHFHRLQPYGKGLIGFGKFNFPYNYATGNYLVVTAGGGVDFALRRRIQIRVADAEWQYWPQFTYGAMTTLGVSAGVKIKIF
jgi:hypothetical protein